MAKAIKVPTQTTTIDEKKVYIDITKMGSKVTEIDESFSYLISNLEGIRYDLKDAKGKASYGALYKKVFADASAHVADQITRLKKRRKGLQAKYNNDKTEMTLNVLQGKVNELEEAIKKLLTAGTDSTTTANTTTSNATTADTTTSSTTTSNAATADTTTSSSK